MPNPSQIIQLSASRRPTTLLTLDPSPAPTAAASSTSAPASTPNPNVNINSSTLEPDSNSNNSNTAHGPTPGTGPTPYAISSVSWAPSCGRSYHLIATGGRDGRVRIWRVRPGADDVDGEGVGIDAEGGGDDGKWTASVVADFDQHKYVYVQFHQALTYDDSTDRLLGELSGILQGALVEGFVFVSVHISLLTSPPFPGPFYHLQVMMGVYGCGKLRQVMFGGLLEVSGWSRQSRLRRKLMLRRKWEMSIWINQISISVFSFSDPQTTEGSSSHNDI